MADLFTANEVMDFWDNNATSESKAERHRMEALEKDIDTARKYIREALVRYRKDKTRSRSKAKAEDPFDELKEYTSRRDIQDAFGWDLISEKEMDRLQNLWDLREKSNGSSVFIDRVTEMLEQAIRAVGNEYDEEIIEFHDERRKQWRDAERIARENLERR